MAARKRTGAPKKKAAKKKAAKKKAARRRPASSVIQLAKETTPGHGATRPPKSDPHSMGDPGRPTDYTPELADHICLRLGNGESLLKLCRDDDAMPSRFTVMRWTMGIGLSRVAPEELARFRDNYNIARLAYEEHTFERLEAVDEDVRLDQMSISRGKLWSDNMKWALARRNRAVYGDRTDLNVGGQADKPVETKVTHSVSEEDAKALRKIGRRIATKGATE